MLLLNKFQTSQHSVAVVQVSLACYTELQAILFGVSCGCGLPYTGLSTVDQDWALFHSRVLSGGCKKCIQLSAEHLVSHLRCSNCKNLMQEIVAVIMLCMAVSKFGEQTSV